MEIHRTPECALTRLWELDAAAISNRSALRQQQEQQRVKWANVDMSTVSFAPGAVVVSANNNGSSFRFSLAECIAPTTLYRLSLKIQLPQQRTKWHWARRSFTRRWSQQSCRAFRMSRTRSTTWTLYGTTSGCGGMWTTYCYWKNICKKQTAVKKARVTRIPCLLWT
uniref:Uncharacterized protein n=1 Tax=Hyaloperonospora arabidopsidis (strain Emoy2) TaxID=559515 RepID=M4BVS4_HYAAE